jgi:hypothetical protein
MTQTTDNDETSQLFRTVRALELLAESHDAHAHGDVERCQQLVDQAVTECGDFTVQGIRGGMLIGEIPMPYDERWHRYLDHQRDRLAAELNAATEPDEPDVDETPAYDGNEDEDEGPYVEIDTTTTRAPEDELGDREW